MKTAKLIIGIVSIVFFNIIVFQSCAVGVMNFFESNSEDISGTAGILLAFAMLIAGIVGIATRKSKGGGITSGVFYLVGAIIGFENPGAFSDLAIWSVLSLIFGIFFIIGSAIMKKAPISQPYQPYQPYYPDQQQYPNQYQPPQQYSQIPPQQPPQQYPQQLPQQYPQQLPQQYTDQQHENT